jgi:hypothetical protein
VNVNVQIPYLILAALNGCVNSSMAEDDYLRAFARAPPLLHSDVNHLEKYRPKYAR